MSITTKVGAVTFIHNASMTGEIEIERAGLAVKVPFEALLKIVSDKVRQQMIEGIEELRPHEILALAASKASKKA
ncbi:hypothetical protein EJD96_15965 [Herbaspirillum seropedicae]|uniref:hypothetical protein n=1 Tax=Herbaspirillum seropedicae TaxID=964 RepID=UPI0011216144|nr:hypothetical protein [Herbaspirillum seropedicae]QDD65546.1 hypothetical protein EJD96_15965 [Herbaspirillum seropedicae]